MPTRASIGIMVMAAFAAASTALAADTIEGFVYEDRNGDGGRQRSEPGIAGVAVSNGLDVVATDEKGRYRIAIAPGDTLFISKPRGWAVPLSPDNLPRFYHHHVPGGAPDDWRPRYRGLQPSGPLPESIDFPLIPSPEPERFTSIWFADPQPQTRDEVEFIRDDVVTELVGVDAAFGITLGDIAYDDLSLFPRLYRNLGEIDVPWYHVPGNHDVNFLSPDDDQSLETFRRHFGPPYYSFDFGPVHFVALDTVHYEGTSAGSEDPDPLGAGSYVGALGERQLQWLANDLELVPAERSVVLAMHIPLSSQLDPDSPSINVRDRGQLFEILAGRRHLLALAGHLHIAEHFYFDADDGFEGPRPLHLHTLSAVSGSWWSGPLDERGIPVSLQRDGAPRGYYLMDVDSADIRLRFRATGKPSDHQMRITVDTGFPRPREEIRRDYRHGELLGNRLELSQLYAARVLVNLFDGGPRSDVRFRIGAGPERGMERVLRTDPFVEELFQRQADTIKPWVEAIPSTHLWSAPLPDGLGPGVHTITVVAVDEYGAAHTEHKLFEVYSLFPAAAAGD